MTKVALIQMTAGKSVDDNLGFLAKQLAEAARQGVEFCLTPETSNFMELDRVAALTRAQTEEQDKAVSFFAQMARRYQLWLLAGSVVLRSDHDRLCNRSILFDPTGRIAARYDKIHLFDVDLGDGETYRESALYDGGDKAVMAQTPLGIMGLTICYDVRFPGLYRDLAKSGADIICIPAAFTVPTGEAHWHTLIRARAIENGCFIMAPAQVGQHETGRVTYGHSLIVDPWGHVLLDAGQQTGVYVMDIDIGHVKRTRQKMPSLQHDRPYMLSGNAE